MTRYYLGLDCSTQSLTAMLLQVDETSASRPATVVFEHAVVFDEELPHYGTRHGVLQRRDGSVALSPPAMWAEALEHAMRAVADSGVDVSRIEAIAASAQQHGSVYLNRRASAILAHLDPERLLAQQLEGAAGPGVPRDAAATNGRAQSGIFSRPVSPIWMDASTTEECHEITAAIGGSARLARITGSRAFERFTGPQIRRFYKHDPEGWAATEHVHLVSSFVTSLLIGGHAPLDPGDAAGMNLMDLRTCEWSAAALGATAPGLARRLPAIVPSSTIVGVLSPYWRRRLRLPAARVVVGSGDNPCSLIGTGLIREGQVAVSLGTSDTLFGLMLEPRVDDGGTGHVFGAPTGDYMGLTCFANGSLARERVRDAYRLDWNGFSAALRATPAGNDGAMMLPWFEPEITPRVSTPRVRRFDLEPDDAARNVRAVVEAQMMALANHCRWMKVDIDVIHATGGAAANAEILQVMAEVFDAEVRRFAANNSACLGAALRARQAVAAAAAGDGPQAAWENIVRGVAEPLADAAVRPRPEHVEAYVALRRRHAELEARALAALSEDSG